MHKEKYFNTSIFTRCVLVKKLKWAWLSKGATPL